MPLPILTLHHGHGGVESRDRLASRINQDSNNSRIAVPNRFPRMAELYQQFMRQEQYRSAIDQEQTTRISRNRIFAEDLNQNTEDDIFDEYEMPARIMPRRTNIHDWLGPSFFPSSIIDPIAPEQPNARSVNRQSPYYSQHGVPLTRFFPSINRSVNSVQSPFESTFFQSEPSRSRPQSDNDSIDDLEENPSNTVPILSPSSSLIATLMMRLAADNPVRNSAPRFANTRLRQNNSDPLARNSDQPNISSASDPYAHQKHVHLLHCVYCSHFVCHRGMKATLLSNTSVQLFSTDAPPPNAIQLLDEDYCTITCQCQLRDIGCLQCGNILGYHVTQPCSSCMSSSNNGHFWMFYAQHVYSMTRLDRLKRPVTWHHLQSSVANNDLNTLFSDARNNAEPLIQVSCYGDLTNNSNTNSSISRSRNSPRTSDNNGTFMRSYMYDDGYQLYDLNSNPLISISNSDSSQRLIYENYCR
jgi:hypothetical protein